MSSYLPRPLIDAVRDLDEAQLRRLLILARGLLETSAEPPSLADIAGMPSVRYHRKQIRCGKACGSCPHGPYWYATWKQDGRTQTLYIGRVLAAEMQRLLDAAAPDDDPSDVTHVATVTTLGQRGHTA